MFEDDLSKEKVKLNEVNETLKDIGTEKKKIQEVPMTYELFLELFNKLPDLMRKSKNLSDIDKILKLFFSNFTLKNKKVASYELNSTFKEMMEITEKSKIVSGREEATNLEHIEKLSLSIIENWSLVESENLPLIPVGTITQDNYIY